MMKPQDGGTCLPTNNWSRQCANKYLGAHLEWPLHLNELNTTRAMLHTASQSRSGFLVRITPQYFVPSRNCSRIHFIASNSSSEIAEGDKLNTSAKTTFSVADLTNIRNQFWIDVKRHRQRKAYSIQFVAGWIVSASLVSPRDSGLLTCSFRSHPSHNASMKLWYGSETFLSNQNRSQGRELKAW